MKFLIESAFFHTVNQWIRDGSDLIFVANTEDGIWVDLRGKDGCREELVLFHTREAYDADSRLLPAAE